MSKLQKFTDILNETYYYYYHKYINEEMEYADWEDFKETKNGITFYVEHYLKERQPKNEKKEN